MTRWPTELDILSDGPSRVLFHIFVHSVTLSLRLQLLLCLKLNKNLSKRSLLELVRNPGRSDARRSPGCVKKKSLRPSRCSCRVRVCAAVGTGQQVFSSGSSVSGEEVSGRGQGSQAARHVGKQRQIRKTLDVRLQLLPNLGHPRQLLLVLL